MALKTKMFRRLKRSRALPTLAAILVLLTVAGIGWQWKSGSGGDDSSSDTAPVSLVPSKNKAKPSATSTSNSAKTPVVSDIAPSSGDLKAPDRVIYVSNHSPSSVTDAEFSSLSTSPGANGQIRFTMNGITKSLPAKQAGSDGLINWSWKPSQIGLTSGSWRVIAVVTLNSQTKSSSDVILLQIP